MIRIQYNRRLVARGRRAYAARVAFSSSRGRHLTIVVVNSCDDRSGARRPVVILANSRRHLTPFILHDGRPIRILDRTQ